MRAEETQILRWVPFFMWVTPEGRALVESLYREQAARTIQRQRRSTKKATSVAIPDPVTHSDSLLHVLQEPIGIRYKDHATKINANHYLSLDFADAEFVRNLYKCVRLGAITLNQFHFALQLYQAKAWLCDYEKDHPGCEQCHVYRYDDKNGPYQVSDVDNAEGTFYQRLINEEDKTYISINFSGFQEYCFFIDGILRGLVAKDEFFSDLLVRYLEKLVSGVGREKFQTFLKTQERSDIKHFIDSKLRFVGKNDYLNRYSIRSEKSTRLLAAIINSHESNPGVIRSPDYREGQKTPVLSFVLTTLESEAQLQRIFHGCETSIAAPTVGPLTMRMIRALDERTTEGALHALYAHQYSHYQSAVRPIELTHPDVKSTDYPHEIPVNDFMLTYHDRYHVWRNGANFKNPIRHVRQLLSHRGICQKQDFVMTFSIWLLSDMDMFESSNIRVSFYKKEENSIINEGVLLFVFRILNHSGAMDENADLFLLLFIDMIRHAEIWDGFMCAISPASGITTLESLVLNDAKSVGQPLRIAYEDKSLVDCIRVNADRAVESIILRCKLRNVSRASDLCDMVDVIGLPSLFYWNMNSGLHIQSAFKAEWKAYCGSEKMALDALAPADIMALLLFFVMKKGTPAQHDRLKNHALIQAWLNFLLDSGYLSLVQHCCEALSLNNDRVRQINGPKIPDGADGDLIFCMKPGLDVRILVGYMQNPDTTSAVKKAILLHPKWLESCNLTVVKNNEIFADTLLLIANASRDHEVIKSISTHPSCNSAVALAILKNRNVVIALDDLQAMVDRFKAEPKVQTTWRYHPRFKIGYASRFALLQVVRATREHGFLWKVLSVPELSSDLFLAILENPVFSDALMRIAVAHRDFPKLILPDSVRLKYGRFLVTPAGAQVAQAADTRQKQIDKRP